MAGTRRVGHLGTLDPSATGVLPLAVREATKLVAFLQGGWKVYRGTIRLGADTDTLDAEGAVVRRHEGRLPERARVEAALEPLRGDIEQVPPMYSSVKHGGIPLYRLARRGETVERQPRKVRIETFALHAYRPPDLDVEVVCSPGTYVRVLAADLGQALGCGAHLLGLERTRSDPFTAEQAFSIEELSSQAEAGTLVQRLLPPAPVLGLPILSLGAEEARRIGHGAPIPARGAGRGPLGTRVTGLSADGALMAVLELGPDQRLQPLRVLHLLAVSD